MSILSIFISLIILAIFPAWIIFWTWTWRSSIQCYSCGFHLCYGIFLSCKDFVSLRTRRLCSLMIVLVCRILVPKNHDQSLTVMCLTVMLIGTLLESFIQGFPLPSASPCSWPYCWFVRLIPVSKDEGLSLPAHPPEAIGRQVVGRKSLGGYVAGCTTCRWRCHLGLHYHLLSPLTPSIIITY